MNRKASFQFVTLTFSIAVALLIIPLTGYGSEQSEQRQQAKEIKQEGRQETTETKAEPRIEDDDPGVLIIDSSPTAEAKAESDAEADLWQDAANAPADEERVDDGRPVDQAVVGEEAMSSAKRCANPSPLKFFPVRAKHDTGTPNRKKGDPSADDPRHWRCDAKYSTSDFYKSSRCSEGKGHYGIDIMSKKGANVVATVSGTVIQSEYRDYSGNIITIQDDCGWVHSSMHLNDRKVKKGNNVVAGQLIGHVGNTGTSSGGSYHLHYSVYPGIGNYCKGKNPHAALKKVEKDVCWTPQKCGQQVCGKDKWCFNNRRCCGATGSPGCPL